MIYLIVAKQSSIYNGMDTKVSENVSLIYHRPEGNLTSSELIQWVKDVVNDHVIHRDVVIFSAHPIVFNAFRLEIKQGRLNAEDLKVKFYHLEADRLICDKIVVQLNGNLNWPKGFLDEDEELAVELLTTDTLALRKHIRNYQQL